MKGLPREIWLLIIRHGVAMAGAVLMAKGFLTQEDAAAFNEAAATVIGALMALGGLAWSAKRKVDRARKAEVAR
jgi:predicted phage tail protein